MPPSSTRQEWPNGIYSAQTFRITGEPPVTFRSQNGKSYATTTAINSQALKEQIGLETAHVSKLWSTGLFGLVYNDQTKIYSAVKLFRVDLVASQDLWERLVPYVFWNKFTPSPFPPAGDADWHFLTNKRSRFKYKTATQLREWIDHQNNLKPGFVNAPDRVDRDGGLSILDEFGAGPSPSTSLGAQFFDLRVNDYLTIQLPISSHPWATGNWYRNFGDVVIAALRRKGFSAAAIAQSGYEIIDAAIRKLEALSAPGSDTTSVGGGTTGSSGRKTPPSNNTVTPLDPINSFNVKVRLPSGAQLVDTDAMSKIAPNTIKPHLRQAFTNRSGEKTEETFYFEYVPSTISYTLGGSTWNEIPRTLDAPIVEWSSYGLTRVQMTFLVAGTRLVDIGNGQTTVPDGLNVSIEDRIQLLRRMASRTSPVVVYGLDDIFNIQLERSQVTGVPCSWAISDLSITAKRRTDGTPSRISVAQVNMSLIEFPIEITSAFTLPTLQLQTPPPPAPGSRTGGTTAIRPDLWTEFLMKPVENVLLVEG